MEFDEIKTYIENNLSHNRFLHSIGVAEEAVKMAERYGVDKKKAYLAGLLHDCTKELSCEEALLLMKKHNLYADRMMSPKLFHGLTATIVAKEKFGVSDKEVLDAVRFHTTGKENMMPLTKIIYISDFIEPGRNFDGVDKVRSLAYLDMDEAIIAESDMVIELTLHRGDIIHPDTIMARNFLILDRKRKNNEGKN